MGKSNNKAKVFAFSLRREMTARKLSVRALGRMTDAADPERGRRRVQRHLSGNFMPSVASQQNYADALGLPRDFFFNADDDMEDPIARVRRELQRLERAVRS